MNPSPLTGLYKLSLPERVSRITELAGLTAAEQTALDAGLSLAQADAMIENVIGRFALPMGVATNFVINGRPVIIPMAVEEPSIVAAVSFAAKLAGAGGGFITSSSQPVMIGQVQILDLNDLDAAGEQLLAAKDQLLAAANQHHPTIQSLGGGAKDIQVRPLPHTPAGPMLILHLLYDCRDAMGANAVNTAVESIAPLVEELTGGRVNLRILSNLTDHRTARAECSVPVDELTRHELAGADVAQSIFEAWAFAAADPYRAATHNKGVMNGIDAVALATGNDWRAVEAGAHAFAARDGRYTSLTDWSLQRDHAGQITHLRGVLDIPLSVGTVGGATKAHPTARTCMKILGQPNARQLAEIMAAVGLAQILAAIRALAGEGIQRGHMRLHARQMALAAGAMGAQVQQIADQLVAEGNIRTERARELIATYDTRRSNLL